MGEAALVQYFEDASGGGYNRGGVENFQKYLIGHVQALSVYGIRDPDVANCNNGGKVSQF